MHVAAPEVAPRSSSRRLKPEPAPGSNKDALMDDFCRFNGTLDLEVRNLLPGHYSVYVYARAPDQLQARAKVYGTDLGGAWPAHNRQLLDRTYTVKHNVPVARRHRRRRHEQHLRWRGPYVHLNAVQERASVPSTDRSPTGSLRWKWTAGNPDSTGDSNVATTTKHSVIEGVLPRPAAPLHTQHRPP
ncbi:MAG: hypothetical protein ACJA0P_001476 [Planctomycetota bacterium]|jgi:hypothetical protein